MITRMRNKISLDDQRSLILMRNQVDTADSYLRLQVISVKEYNQIMRKIVRKLEDLEEKYGIEDHIY